LQKHEEARIAKAATIGNIRIIDLAVTPKAPIKPRVRLNLLLGMVAGLLLALGMAFFLEFIDDSLKSIEEVERVIRKPVYGIIPPSPTTARSPRPRGRCRPTWSHTTARKARSARRSAPCARTFTSPIRTSN
jgi:hypothetical protein